MKKNNFLKFSLCAIAIASVFILFGCHNQSNSYKEVSRPTKKIGEGKNDVTGIVLHHTAEKSINETLASLCDSKREASTHVVIDEDGTRYILAQPEAITWHAGYSILNGREKCNEFTIGIEFQGNTVIKPLTQDQINSAIEYIIPIMKKYNIPTKNIVTHEQIRHDWMVKHPDLVKEKNVLTKCDITKSEYNRFMKALNEKLQDLDAK